MNLLFAINKSFIPLFKSCIRSVVRNGGEEHYDAYFLHSDLSPSEQNDIAGAAGEVVTCRFIGIDPEMFDGFPESKRYPKQIYYRLAAPLLLPDDLDRVLYLDVDTVVLKPLRELYDIDFLGGWYAACTHIRGTLQELNRHRLDAPKGSVYINTGVMVLDLVQLRKVLRLEDIRDYAARKMHTFILPDQDILMGLHGDRVRLVDTFRYNLSDRMIALHNGDPRNEKIDAEWVWKNAVILHFSGRNKPWSEGYHGILGEFYEPYREM